jgi:uncharacterized membrane protein YedE/YeeE
MHAATPSAVPTQRVGRAESFAVYVLIGTVLGVIFLKAEVASWFRIQEMFRFQAFHMYGVIGSAVAVGAAGVAWVRRSSTTVRGTPIQFPEADERRPGPRHLAGGICFGVGWGLLGACPGPIYALLGSGLGVMAVALAAALAGAWIYGRFRQRLPH